jgi:hypothetical protein
VAQGLSCDVFDRRVTAIVHLEVQAAHLSWEQAANALGTFVFDGPWFFIKSAPRVFQGNLTRSIVTARGQAGAVLRHTPAGTGEKECGICNHAFANCFMLNHLLTR